MSNRTDTVPESVDGGSSGAEPSGTGTHDGPTPPLSKDTIFELLKNQRRRYVLQYLADDPGPVRLRDLAERIAAWENDKPMSALSSDERKRVYVGLYQCHLTKMDDASVVAFNQDRGLITLGEHAPLLYEYLDPRGSTEGTWSLGYLGLALASAVLALLAEAGLLFGTLSANGVTGVVVAGFCLLALVHAAAASVLDLDRPTALLDAVTDSLADTGRS
jgi:hypothetical protein